MRAIRLQISDAALCRAIAVIAGGAGYTVTDDSLAPLVTDSVTAAEGKRSLYVGREEPNVKTEYLHRPFSEEDLLSALEALCGDVNVEKSGIRIDKKRSVAYVDGFKVTLTEREMRLFSLLVANRGKAVSDVEIVEKVFDGQTVQGSNVCAVYVNYLRKKIDRPLGKNMIVRMRGSGYMLK